MANVDYIRNVIRKLHDHECKIQAFEYLVRLIPEEDKEFQILSMLHRSISDSFEELQEAVIKVDADLLNEQSK